MNPFGPTLDDVQLVDLTPVVAEAIRPDLYFGIQLPGKVGSTNRIDYRLDLTRDWEPFTNVVLSSSPFLWVDPVPAGHVQRFYRAIELK